MITKINLITVWTNNIDDMKQFYNKVLGFNIKSDLGNYVEFENEGARFAICERVVMHSYSDEFKSNPKGQILELAFECENESELEATYKDFITKNVEIIQAPKVMPWGQKTCLFCDPDGNIHEIFTEVKK